MFKGLTVGVVVYFLVKAICIAGLAIMAKRGYDVEKIKREIKNT